MKQSRILVVVWMLLQPVLGVAPAQAAQQGGGGSGTMSTDAADADSLAAAGLAEIEWMIGPGGCTTVLKKLAVGERRWAD